MDMRDDHNAQDDDVETYMSSDVNAMVEDGIRAYRAGDKDRALDLLMKATESDPEHEKGWMWLSAVVDTDGDRRICLENVLFINPDNKNAQRGLEKLNRPKTGQLKAPPEPAEPEKKEETEESAPPSTPPFVAPPTATSSASAVYDPSNEMTAEHYDNWIGDLGIGASAETASPFTDDDDARDLLSTSEFANIFQDAFVDDDFDEDEESDTPAASAGEPAALSASEDKADDLFSSGPFSSGAFDDSFDVFTPDASDNAVIGSPPRSPAPQSPTPEPTAQDASTLSGGDFFASDTNATVSDNLDPSLLFRRIPKQIKPTRLPGTNEGYPASIKIGLTLLIAMNIVGVAALVINGAG